MTGDHSVRPAATHRGMFVRESGDPGSPAIVFLHGVGNSGGMWAQHLTHLETHHCLAPDLPGFGRSNGLAWSSLVDTAARVARLIEATASSGRAHVVGLSLGGAVAHQLLATRSDLLDRVVIDGCSALPWWGARAITAGVAALSPFIHTDAVVSTVGRVWRLDDESRHDLKAASPRAFRRGFADANDVRMTAAELAAPCPTLLVAGEKEVRPPVRSSNAALAALMPQAQARYLPGHAHGWLGAEPELHRRMIRAWIGGDELPAELLPETSSWDASVVERVLAGP